MHSRGLASTSHTCHARLMSGKGLRPVAAPGSQRSSSVKCRAELRVRRTLPIFPLNVVALPAATVPLMIFEARCAALLPST